MVTQIQTAATATTIIMNVSNGRYIRPDEGGVGVEDGVDVIVGDGDSVGVDVPVGVGVDVGVGDGDGCSGVGLILGVGG